MIRTEYVVLEVYFLAFDILDYVEQKSGHPSRNQGLFWTKWKRKTQFWKGKLLNFSIYEKKTQFKSEKPLGKVYFINNEKTQLKGIEPS